MGALIRPRGCSKAEEAHQNSPGGKDRGVTLSHLRENCSLVTLQSAGTGTQGTALTHSPTSVGKQGAGAALPAPQAPLPAAPTLPHLGTGRCPLLLLCQLGRHQLVQLLHGQAGHGPPGSLDLLQDVGELGPAWTAAC